MGYYGAIKGDRFRCGKAGAWCSQGTTSANGCGVCLFLFFGDGVVVSCDGDFPGHSVRCEKLVVNDGWLLLPNGWCTGRARIDCV